MKKKLFCLLAVILSFLIVGCVKNDTAREAVRDYMERYVTLDSKIVNQIDEFTEKENLNDEQKMMYREILKKQYSTMSYDIIEETYEGDIAYIKVKIKVFDLYKVQKEAMNYFKEHSDEFNDENGEYDRNKYLDFKLNKMKNVIDTVEHELDIKVVKTDDKWEVSQLSNKDLEKIHGVYNYDE